MAYINENYLKLQTGYLFPEIGRRVNEFSKANPEAATRLIRCGIGDVTEALPEACTSALHAAVDEMSNRDTFKGYGPELGYDFLREAIAHGDFASRGVEVSPSEIFISMEPSATQQIFSISLVIKTESQSQILCILCI